MVSVEKIMKVVKEEPNLTVRKGVAADTVVAISIEAEVAEVTTATKMKDRSKLLAVLFN